MSQLTEEEVATLQEVYNELNGEEGGGLKKEKLLKMSQVFGLNLTMNEIEEELEEFDTDKDGDLDFEELKKLVEHKYRSKEDQNGDIINAVKTLLSSYDLGEDEFLTKDQLKEFLMGKGDDPLTEEDINEIFAALDKNEDNQISAQELAVVLGTE